MPRKIIICCDGTGNEIRENESNVLKFYRVLKESASQIAFYDPGVGTISDSGAWAAFKNKAKGVFGLATGYGLDENVLDAYAFLVDHYKPKDEIWLFGFSRGAHTVRVLAGFINLVGVLKAHQRHLGPYALTSYKQAAGDGEENYRTAWRVQEVLDTHRPTIRFMGCWDTVGSVIVPRPDRMYVWPSMEVLPFTQANPCVQVFRHAIAIDERRRMFRLSRWDEPQLFKPVPYLKDDHKDVVPQDVKQVWFAGVHSDIGGGYPEDESALAKIPLGWMVGEAREHGLQFRDRLVKYLVDGDKPDNHPRDYTAPDPAADQHDSMNPAWRLLEVLPKRSKWRDDPEKRGGLGAYLPFAERRWIPPDAQIHPSVWQRVDARKDYKPKNLPPRPGA